MGTGAWMGIALIAGFYLGAMLMSLLSIARDGKRADLEPVRLGADRRPGAGKAARTHAAAPRS